MDYPTPGGPVKNIAHTREDEIKQLEECNEELETKISDYRKTKLVVFAMVRDGFAIQRWVRDEWVRDEWVLSAVGDYDICSSGFGRTLLPPD